jgi:hypothetical protein
MKHLIKITLKALLLIVVFTACSKDDNPKPDLEPQTNVYVTGYESNGTTFIAKLWKNGAATNLSDGINNTVALSVYVHQNDVYVSGYESGALTIAKLWKNGAATNLLDGTRATSVYVVTE